MTGRMIKNLIEVRQGDSFVVVVHLLQNGTDVDLSDSIGCMQVRDSDGLLIWEIEAAMISAEEGRILFEITPEKSSIDVGDYQCDIQLKMSDGSVNTIFPANVNQIGILRITKQITRES